MYLEPWYVGFAFGLAFSCLCLCFSIAEKEKKSFTISLLCVSICLFSLFLPSISKYETTFKEIKYKIVEVDGIMCCNIDGEVVNINKELDRNFKEGEELTSKHYTVKRLFFQDQKYKIFPEKND